MTEDSLEKVLPLRLLALPTAKVWGGGDNSMSGGGE